MSTTYPQPYPVVRAVLFVLCEYMDTELKIVKLRQKIMTLEGRVTRKEHGRIKRLLKEKEEANLQLLRRNLLVTKERDDYKEMVEKLLSAPVDNSKNETGSAV